MELTLLSPVLDQGPWSPSPAFFPHDFLPGATDTAWSQLGNDVPRGWPCRQTKVGPPRCPLRK